MGGVIHNCWVARFERHWKEKCVRTFLVAIEMIFTIIRNRNEARKDKLERGVNLFFKVLCDKHNNL